MLAVVSDSFILSHSEIPLTFDLRGTKGHLKHAKVVGQAEFSFNAKEYHISSCHLICSKFAVHKQ